VWTSWAHIWLAWFCSLENRVWHNSGLSVLGPTNIVWHETRLEQVQVNISWATKFFQIHTHDTWAAHKTIPLVFLYHSAEFSHALNELGAAIGIVESPSLILVINDTKLLMPCVKCFELGISNICDEGVCGKEWWPQDHKETVHGHEMTIMIEMHIIW
jgi:hypothetical protein